MTVPAAAFVDTIARVARAASRDETRPHLTGVLVTASGRELRMVATDSYRLSVKETQLEEALDGSLEANVPARTLQELGRIAGGRRERDDRHRGAREPGRLHASATWCSPRAWSRGDSRTISSCCPSRTSTSCGSTARSCSRSCAGSACWRRRTRRCGCASRRARSTVSAQTPDVGEASESLPVPFAGEPLEIGFNPEFFRDGLESAESEELILKLISPLRPGPDPVG